VNRELLRVAAPWVAAALVDAYATLGSWPRPLWWQFAFEIVLLALAGRVQWKLARGWLRTPLLPAAAVAFFAAAFYAPHPPLQLAAYLVGLLAGLGVVVRIAGARLRVSPAAGVVVAALVVLACRYLDAVSPLQPQIVPLRTLVGELTWPLRAVGSAEANNQGPPVVVISVDTLRADAARDMETVRRLARRGAYWPRAMSTANWTLPALASLQTGRMPSEHGAGCFAGGHCQGVFDHVPFLAEDLRAAGYATAAVVTNPWVTSGTGFDRGFGTFIESGNTLRRLLVAGAPVGPHRQDSQYVIDAAIDWLSRAPARGFYLWVHVVDPHMPYRHGDDPFIESLSSTTIRTALPLSADSMRAVRAAYAAEVAYVDRQVVRLLDALEARGVLEDGVVVFTSDHGEELWDHDGIEHGHSHHGEVVDVPLVLVAPGVAPGTRTGVASLVDAASTIRAAAGLEPRGLDLRKGVPADRVATAWGGVVLHIDCSARDAHARAIVRDCSAAPTAAQVYDLDADPRELHPLDGVPGDRVLAAARAVEAPTAGKAARLHQDALRELGYLQ